MAGICLVEPSGRPLAVDGDVAPPQLPNFFGKTKGFVSPGFPFFVAAPIASLSRPDETWLVLWDDAMVTPEAASDCLARIEAFAAQLSITRMIEAENRNRAMFERAAKTARIGLWSCSLPQETLEWSEGVYELFDLPVGSTVSRQETLAMYTPASRIAMQTRRAEAIANCGEFSVDAEIVTAKGRRRWIRITGTVDVVNGVATRVFGVKQDITEEKLLAEETHRLATTDPMTGLANRGQFQARLDRDVGALLLIDLDGFKAINDTFGHVVGDAYLIEAARRMAERCRLGMLIARLGGDEFAVIIDSYQADQARTIADQIVAYLREPFVFEGVQRTITASIGIAYGNSHGSDALYRAADKALYDAKSGGRDTWREFSPQSR